MSAYKELIKNFERVRAYMREFYVYGFKSRDDFTGKSARSYDDERRRVESWLGEHMRFVRTTEGKNVFLSIDSRAMAHNPLYKAWKSKSFTDGDITLHFILFDILHAPDVALTLAEIMERVDFYLCDFKTPMLFDESTVRKKLKEYTSEGIVTTERQGKKLLYRRANDTLLPETSEWLNFYSEIAPCGVIGSFLSDKRGVQNDLLSFKHHYITSAPDSDVLATLFTAMREKRIVTATNHSRKADEPRHVRMIPLRIFISVQNGRQHVLAYHTDSNSICSFRLDYLSDVKLQETTPRFDELRIMLDEMRPHMWGVIAGSRKQRTEHIEFTIAVDEGEQFIVKRLQREKRVGTVEKIDEHTYRFSAEVYDASELHPWIRTFICRITDYRCSNQTLETRFKRDLAQMYRMYGIGGAEK